MDFSLMVVADFLCFFIIGYVWYLLYMAVNNPHARNDGYLLVGFHLQARRIYTADVRVHPGLLLCHHRAS